MPRARSPEADPVSALERGFRVLDCFAEAGRPLGNGEVAARTGIPKPSVARLIGTLQTLGHLRAAAEHERYELAPGVVRLAEAFLAGLDLRAVARPHLQALAEATGTSAFLGVRDGADMLVIEAGRARSAVAVLGADVGTRMALATSALGRAWLAAVDPATRARALGGAPDAALQAALAMAREQGHVLSLGEWHPAIVAAAVPLRTARGEVVSLNCGGPTAVLSARRLHDEVLPRLHAAARAIAAQIGGQAGLDITQDERRRAA
jgi:DNA-binding IclR family transcriptional regulator